MSPHVLFGPNQALKQNKIQSAESIIFSIVTINQRSQKVSQTQFLVSWLATIHLFIFKFFYFYFNYFQSDSSEC